MGQAKQTCPYCRRPPGSIHRARCPRSTARFARVNAALAASGRPRPFWLFGPQVVTVGKKRHHTDNPGIPYVDQTRGKPWFAGGVPDAVRRQMEASR